MKTAKEIQALRLKIREFAEKKLDDAKAGKQDKRDQDLAALVSTPGWEIVENFYEQLICKLLEPEPFDEIDTEAYVIRSQSKLVVIDALEQVMTSVKDADTRMKAVAGQTSGTSE